MSIRRLWTLLLLPAFALVACEQPTGTTAGTAPAEDAPAANQSAGPGAGTAPAEDCDVTVDDDAGETIQGAVDAASGGEVICVEPGTYDEQVTVDKEVTLQGRTAPRGGNPAEIDGWVSMEAEGAELRRMAVTRSDPIDAPSIDAFGVRVTASQTAVWGNVVHSLTGESKKSGAINGIQAFGGEAISDIEIRDNIVRDFRNDATGGAAGIKLQADLRNVLVKGNSVTDLHAAGWAFGVVVTGSGSAEGLPEEVVVKFNTMDRLNDGSEFDVFEDTGEGDEVFPGAEDGRDGPPFPGTGFGMEADATEATVRYNNLLAPNGAESKDEGETLAAECNWWGDRSGPFDPDDGDAEKDNPDGEGTWALERGDAAIDFTPWLNAPAPSQACVGGEQPGNGDPGNGEGPGNGGGGPPGDPGNSGNAGNGNGPGNSGNAGGPGRGRG